MLEDDRAEVEEILATGQDAYRAANPAYEEMEGIVAGVPRLAQYDVDIDAGADASDPENAVSFSLELPDGEVLKQPGNFMFLTETSWFATNEDFLAKGAEARRGRRRRGVVRRGHARRELPGRSHEVVRRDGRSARCRRADLRADRLRRLHRHHGDDADDVRVLRGLEGFAIRRGRRNAPTSSPPPRACRTSPTSSRASSSPTRRSSRRSPRSRSSRRSRPAPRCAISWPTSRTFATARSRARSSPPSRRTPSALRHSGRRRRSPGRSPRRRSASGSSSRRCSRGSWCGPSPVSGRVVRRPSRRSSRRPPRLRSPARPWPASRGVLPRRSVHPCSRRSRRCSLARLARRRSHRPSAPSRARWSASFAVPSRRRCGRSSSRLRRRAGRSRPATRRRSRPRAGRRWRRFGAVHSR